MNGENPSRISWYHFIPVVGYFLYLPQSRSDFPDLTGKPKIFMILENTLLYVLLGFLGYVAGTPESLWFPLITFVVSVVTPLEFWVIRRWGHKFRVLGWHRVQSFKGKKLALAILFVTVQTWGFLSLGYLLSGLLAPRV